jgi:hypothetical protein
MGKIRINDLARELEVKSKAILDVLPEIGVTEKKTHSSSLEEHEAEKVRAKLRGTAAESHAGAKAALNALTLGFAAAYGPNVRVNSIVVGPFGTDVAEHWADPPDHARPGFTKAGMRIGRPDEIVGLALYLASDASSFTSGSMVRLDGGPARTRRLAASVP